MFRSTVEPRIRGRLEHPAFHLTAEQPFATPFRPSQVPPPVAWNIGMFHVSAETYPGIVCSLISPLSRSSDRYVSSLPSNRR
jgi:hypothetical protein